MINKCTRWTVFSVAIYFIITNIITLITQKDVTTNMYTLAFEGCTLLYMYETKFHCIYAKNLMISIIIIDAINYIDYYTNIIPINIYNITPITIIITTTLMTITYKAIKHLCKYEKINRKYPERLDKQNK